MNEFINALFDPQIPFFRYAFFSGIAASVAFGIVGTYVVTRRITYIAGAISHCVLGGIGAALYLKATMKWEWLDPIYGAVAAALAAALIIGFVSLKAKQREDTVIGALWSVGMALGIIFIAKTPGYVDAMSYLFGNILLVSRHDLAMVLILDVLVLTLAIFFYNKFQAVCFDEKFARLRGINVEFYYLLLLCLTALTVVLLVTVVGIVMVIALLTLPAAVAGQFSSRLWKMMLLSIVLSMFFTSAGIAVSYESNLPSGPTIILIAGVSYLFSVCYKKIACSKKWRNSNHGS
ncbi:MAG: hypothetical protein A2020_02830 [Lentisphaerae bacterium GWF2_45_14]|nr:MAG: hypothetical protein A2020_02830 [Lentisphaerae bacterium GWF2_45_14]